ncbi:hypothetical protein Smp_148260 [Schistosoma mansoni]|uniref:hypothetical protein n=1 Tax=Schistosoma mansoni TaxID=6183 RepID=UPI00022DBEEC|nr:hypothetical protein Smp_148260 [Schistosoma mansoni]|eukprot:XP_018650032.1 hypothetical protein Smp_148260 [Schistosoma mansoni]
MAINEENFGRLLSRQTSDIETTEQEIISLEKYRSDYESVSNKIQELQKSVYKDAYIPFSRKALVRGIEDDKEIEIREEYDSDAEIEWRKKHVNSRKQERLSNASRRSPVLSTRRVSFDLVEQVLGEHHTDCENISNSESDLDDKNLSTIHFQHSDTPSPIPREKVVDVSTLTIAEAVNFALKICNTHDKKKVFPVEPLGDIMERQPNVLAKAVNLTSEMSSTNHQSEILPTKPFGDINERQQNALDKSDISPPIITNERKRCSLFRSSRIRDSKPS